MKSLTITHNDINIFLTLQEFPCLSLPFLAELLGKTKAVYPREDGKQEVRYEAFRHRLADLRRAGYLTIRQNLRPRKGQKNRHDVYALADKAYDVLSQRGLIVPAMSLTNQADHDVGSAFVIASLKLGVQADPSLRWITSQEILDHAYCPDATRTSKYPFAIPVRYMHRDRWVEMVRSHDWWPFGIERNGRKILFAGIEYDRNSEALESGYPDRPSIERHFRTTLAMLDKGYKDHFGTNKLFTLFVFDDFARMNAAMALLNKMTDGKGAERILFRYMPDWDDVQEFPKADGHMLTQKWHRVGYPDFDILGAIAVQEKKAA